MKAHARSGMSGKASACVIVLHSTGIGATSRQHPNPALAEWLRSLSAPPEHLVLQVVPFEQRFKAEERWTDLLREVPGVADLLNISSGARMSPASLAKKGAVTAALWQTDEYRTKVTEARKAMWQRPEHRAKMHAAMKRRVISPEARANMSAALKGRKDIGETSRRMWADPIKREQIREAQRAAWVRRRAAAIEKGVALCSSSARKPGTVRTPRSWRRRRGRWPRCHPTLTTKGRRSLRRMGSR